MEPLPMKGILLPIYLFLRLLRPTIRPKEIPRRRRNNEDAYISICDYRLRNVMMMEPHYIIILEIKYGPQSILPSPSFRKISTFNFIMSPTSTFFSSLYYRYSPPLFMLMKIFPIFGAVNPGLGAVPLIVILIITAFKDAMEDWRRTIL